MTPMPDWAMLGIGYTLFIASTLVLIKIWSVTPDMLMAAFVFLAAAQILRIRLGDVRWRTFVLLGIVLSLGYLAKAIMFPVSVLFLAAALFAVRDLRLSIPRVLVAFLVFLVICMPYIAALTASKGEFGASGAGTFTYAKHVNGVPFAHWQGETPGNGTPLHPSRKIFEAPPIYEFGTPIGGTYPIGYDPSYWYAGLEVYFNLEQQVEALLGSFFIYFDVFSVLFGGLVFGLIMLYLMSRQPTWRLSDILSDWGLLFIALVVLTFYAVVLVVGRYIGAFVVLFFAVLLANVRLPDSATNKKFASAIAIVAIIFALGSVLVFTLSGYGDFSSVQSTNSSTTAQAGPPGWPGEVSEELLQLGIKQNDKVGVIGYGFDSYWARLARVKIVAELPAKDAARFWLGDPALQDDVMETFAGTGAQAVVAEYVPQYASLGNGWHQVGKSNYYIYFFAN
jgi:4-amino-4-deoxy-L-arabinose transferase-like glycosyltransferase